MDKVQKIREEIARIQLYTQSEVLKQVLDYIDEVQKEPVSEDVVSVAKQYVDSHVFGNEEDKFTRSVLVDMFCSGVQWADEHPKEEAVSEDLEEEIVKRWKVLHGSGNPTPFDTFNGIACHFATWQKEQMMAKAVEGGCFSYKNGFVHISCDVDERITNIKFGDKVKVIVIKED